MAVNLIVPDVSELHPVEGLQLGYAMAGIKKSGQKDMLIMALDEGASAAGVFTQNRFCAAPVQLCKRNLATGHGVRSLVVNTGNANAGTGEQGMRDAEATAQAVATALECKPTEVLVFSTGVILEPLPMDRIFAGVDQAVAGLGKANWLDAAYSILTTDTLPKAYSASHSIEGQSFTVTGISKGSGMIRPNMATMLGYLATDVLISQKVLSVWTTALAEASFNRITVDGDTSTNDSFVVMATGKVSGLAIETGQEPHAAQVYKALLDASRKLAQAIIRDGEGATKFITIQVEKAKTSAEALQVAYAIAHSPLVKTAFFASDPNLGRILAAIGSSGVDDLDANQIDLYLGDVWVATRGGRHPEYSEPAAQRVMNQAEIEVRVVLNRGDVRECVWTSDLSHDYVSINADYRT